MATVLLGEVVATSTVVSATSSRSAKVAALAELLRWQTAALLEREVGRDGQVVIVRPELVVEIALDGAQRSTRYPGGVALRFARVRRYRPDKGPADADSIDAVRALL